MAALRVCLLPQSLDAPSAYRLFFPMRELQRSRGWQVSMPVVERGEGEDDWLPLERGLPDADVYVLHQRNDREWLQVIPQLQADGRVVVCDTDDLYAQLPAWHPAAAALAPVATGTIRDRDGVAVARAKKRRVATVESLHAIYAAADCLTVSTPYLAKAYARRARRVALLPNRLDWSMWEGVPLQFEKRRERLRVGWMGAGEFRRGDLAVLARFLPRWLEQHPDVDFVAAGDPSVHDRLGIPHRQRLSFPRARFRDGGLPKITATMDVGLVPLQPLPFNEAKSALKGMEYAACGIPCVASPTAEYRTFVEPGVTGLLADGPKEWQAALDLLVSDDGLRRRMGAAARVKAATLTIQGGADGWADLYEQLLATRHGSRRTRRGPEARRARVAAGAAWERPSTVRG